MTKEYFLVIDTETANSVEEPLPYDIGYVICDRQGNIYLKRSFVVAEIFLDCQDLMQTAYYAEKIPNYWDDIKNNRRKIKSFYNIRRQIKEDMQSYNINKVGGYNMGFDKKALNNNCRYITKSFIRYFFPYGTEFFCIWNMACSVLLNRKSYRKFADTHNLKTEKGNYMTSAECAYRYITKDENFIENHTGLEDVLIEVAVMTYCYRQHKKMDKSLNSSCWRKVQAEKRKPV